MRYINLKLLLLLLILVLLLVVVVLVLLVVLVLVLILVLLMLLLLLVVVLLLILVLVLMPYEIKLMLQCTRENILKSQQKNLHSRNVTIFHCPESISGLVLDVKCGKGAFIKNENEALSLAQLLVIVTKGLGIQCAALITDMNSPIGKAVGNAVEVVESIQCLSGQGPPDLEELVCEQGNNYIVRLVEY